MIWAGINGIRHGDKLFYQSVVDVVDTEKRFFSVSLLSQITEQTMDSSSQKPGAPAKETRDSTEYYFIP